MAAILTRPHLVKENKNALHLKDWTWQEYARIKQRRQNVSDTRGYLYGFYLRGLEADVNNVVKVEYCWCWYSRYFVRNSIMEYPIIAQIQMYSFAYIDTKAFLILGCI